MNKQDYNMNMIQKKKTHEKQEELNVIFLFLLAFLQQKHHIQIDHVTTTARREFKFSPSIVSTIILIILVIAWCWSWWWTRTRTGLYGPRRFEQQERPGPATATTTSPELLHHDEDDDYMMVVTLRHGHYTTTRKTSKINYN